MIPTTRAITELKIVLQERRVVRLPEPSSVKGMWQINPSNKDASMKAPIPKLKPKLPKMEF